MKKDEFVKSGVYNKHMYNVGLDDYGQQYFIEFLDEETGKLLEVGCGAYNDNYIGELERLFGTPEECEHYDAPKFDDAGYCKNVMLHGYCGRCPNGFPKRHNS